MECVIAVSSADYERVIEAMAWDFGQAPRQGFAEQQIQISRIKTFSSSGVLSREVLFCMGNT